MAAAAAAKNSRGNKRGARQYDNSSYTLVQGHHTRRARRSLRSRLLLLLLPTTRCVLIKTFVVCTAVRRRSDAPAPPPPFGPEEFHIYGVGVYTQAEQKPLLCVSELEANSFRNTMIAPVYYYRCRRLYIRGKLIKIFFIYFLFVPSHTLITPKTEQIFFFAVFFPYTYIYIFIIRTQSEMILSTAPGIQSQLTRHCTRRYTIFIIIIIII